ncbi:hypothetical protein DSUL_160074 [Desulfovibrionales bacterium]
MSKTNIALNYIGNIQLGHCLYKGNYHVLFIDCDLDLANIDVLIDIVSDYSLQDFLKTDLKSKDIIVTIEPGNFDCIAAA